MASGKEVGGDGPSMAASARVGGSATSGLGAGAGGSSAGGSGTV